MSLSDSTLVTYYARIDAGDLDAGLELLAPEVSFAIILPGTAVRGQNRHGVREYLEGRGTVDRRHVPTHATREGELEFVYGAVVEDGVTITGHFLASARIDDDGLITGYQVAFDPELGLASPTLESPTRP
ncbi:MULTISPECIES: nuclear transport factor 2 family protein [Dietzia]|uniref:nuclear transport factor 2 family protein n=1 Tax=Dietzia TaxID=37914 RepID=UPI0022B4FEC8|nr:MULTISPECIES: nuclear transport factor 2 family protein [Dietzia]MCZ4538563.1 nuclear transport factor 2 family protein [Dietzia maris]MDV3355055.1 nuclear transport factor 2 family protein [Dietzia sp. IN118]